MRLIFISLTLITAGCIGQYAQPGNGPTAMLRVKMDNDIGFSWLHTYKEEGCKGPASMGTIGDNEQVRLDQHNTPKGMLGSKHEIDTQIVEQIIPANKPFTVLFSQFLPDYCKLPITFMPKPNRHYEINYDYNGEICYASVSELILAENGDIDRQSVKATKEKSNCNL